MTVSVLQWNVWIHEDIRNIASFLVANKADIICLQELTIDYPGQSESDTVRYLSEQLGYNHYEKFIGDAGKTWQQANAIFTRFPILSRGFQWINKPTGSGSFDDEYRAYIETSLDIGQKQLTVGTTHMSFSKRFTETPRKKEEADNLVSILEAKDKDYIFTGDINTIPDSYTVQSIKKHLKNAGPSFDQGTWTTKPFIFDDFEANDTNWRLDYIFVSKDINVESTEILQTQYPDHLPVMSNLEI